MNTYKGNVVMLKRINKKFYFLIASGVILLFLAGIIIKNHFNKINNSNISGYIPVAFSTDDNYVLPTIVSITSILENSNKNTKYKFYILVPDDLRNDNSEKLQLIKDKYKNCDMSLINMHNEFKNSEKKSWSTAMYYRLRLSGILPEENKCIYLDGDTIVKKDLSELYNIDISDYYVAGVADDRRAFRKDYGEVIGIDNMQHYICSGVLLWNLEKIRNENIESRFDEFIYKKVDTEKVSECPDQDAINAVCFDKILDIPFKYDVMLHMGIKEPYESSFAAQICFSKEEWEEGSKNPAIIHYTGYKPWKNNSTYFYDEWLKYAEKSICFEDIKNEYNIQ